ncbi:pentapeptide repeat-containing protein [Streptomyces sp. NPDC059740]|uniref:pentapeptide repeat-containing protein n=1 Tax=Streptomyces sp. NPDC059740 TaxID=3346926 RepID=UPI003649AF04
MAAQRKANGPVRRVQRPQVRLPELRPAPAAGLSVEGDHDGEEFADADLSAQSGLGARFLDCALRRCALDETELTRARFVDSVLEGVRGVGTDLSEATLRDVEVVDARLGGARAWGAVLERVVVRGGKLDFLNLRGARLRDVAFEDCVLQEVDLMDAVLERVSFDRCTLERADLTGARLTDVDLRGASRLEVTRGIDRLAGAVIRTDQLMELAPAFAAQLGVLVE